MPQLKNRYIHEECGKSHPADDKEELILYLINLYDMKEDYLLPNFMLQLQGFPCLLYLHNP